MRVNLQTIDLTIRCQFMAYLKKGYAGLININLYIITLAEKIINRCRDFSKSHFFFPWVKVQYTLHCTHSLQTLGWLCYTRKYLDVFIGYYQNGSHSRPRSQRVAMLAALAFHVAPSSNKMVIKWIVSYKTWSNSFLFSFLTKVVQESLVKF